MRVGKKASYCVTEKNHFQEKFPYGVIQNKQQENVEKTGFLRYNEMKFFPLVRMPNSSPEKAPVAAPENVALKEPKQQIVTSIDAFNPQTAADIAKVVPELRKYYVELLQKLDPFIAKLPESPNKTKLQSIRDQLAQQYDFLQNAPKVQEALQAGFMGGLHPLTDDEKQQIADLKSQASLTIRSMQNTLDALDRAEPAAAEEQKTLEKTTQENTTSLNTAVTLDKFAHDLQKEDFSKIEADAASRIDAMPVDRLPIAITSRPEEVERRKTFGEFQTGTTMLFLRLLSQPDADKLFTSPESLLAMDPSKLASPLENSIWAKLKVILSQKDTPLRHSMFDNWQDTVATLKGKLSLIQDPEQGTKDENPVVKFLSEQYQKNPQLFATGGLVLAGVTLGSLFMGMFNNQEGNFDLPRFITGLLGIGAVGGSAMFAANNWEQVSNFFTTLGKSGNPLTDFLNGILGKKTEGGQQAPNDGSGFKLPDIKLPDIPQMLSSNTMLAGLAAGGLSVGNEAVKKVTDLATKSPDQIAETTNSDAFKALNSYLDQQKKQDPAKEASYNGLMEKLKPLIEKMDKGTPLTKEDVDALSTSPELLSLGFTLSYEDGYIRISKSVEVDGMNVMAEGFPRVIAVDPTLPHAEQNKNAVRLATQNDWMQVLAVPEKQLAITLQRGLEVFKQRDLGSFLASGGQLVVMGGRVFMTGALERYCLGSVDMLSGVLGTIKDQNAMGMQQVLMQYGSMILPMTFFGLATNLTKLHSPIHVGAIIVKSALAPITGAVKLATMPLTQGYKTGSALLNGSSVQEAITEPLYGQALKLTAKVDKVVRFKYLFNREIFKNYSELAALKNARAHLVDSSRTMAPDILGMGQAKYIEQAEKALKGSPFGKELMSQLLDIDTQNRPKAGEMIDLCIAKTEEIIKLRKQASALPKGSPEATRIEELIERITRDTLSEIKLDAKKFNTPDHQTALEKEQLEASKRLTREERLRVEIERLGGNVPSAGAEPAIRAMEALKATPNSKLIDKNTKLFALYEQLANEALKKELDALQHKGLDADILKNNEQEIKVLGDRLTALKKSFSEGMVEAFSKLPFLQKTKARAEAINHMITDNEGRILTRVLSIKGRTMLFGAEFAVALTAQKLVQVALDKDHDLVKALESVASWDTIQMLADIAPLSGTVSNTVSAISGQKSLSFLSGLGVKLEDEHADRLQSVGWGVVSFGTDLLMFVPGLGEVAKGSVILARLTAIAESGSRLAPVAKALIGIWGKIVALAAENGWKETIAAIMNKLQANMKGIKTATSIGAVGMTTVSLGQVAMAFTNPQELPQAQADARAQ